MRAIFLCDVPSVISMVYPPETVARLKAEAHLDEVVFTKADVLAKPDAFTDVSYIFSTWEMPVFTKGEISTYFPGLKCVFYGAGSVQSFARPFLELGITVISAWVANAVPVAEYTVSQILLANKGMFSTSRLLKQGRSTESIHCRGQYPGNFDVAVGLIGVGQISRLVIQLLRQHRLRIKVCSHSLSEHAAKELGVELCSLEELFATCQVVSNHLADNPSTKGRLQKKHFASMLPYATFLNTGRGAQVVEADLANVLKHRPDLTAVLDVTDPEPPLEEHPFYHLPNCILTPHIAGSSGREVYRMSEYMIDEFIRFRDGEPCRYVVTLDMLKTMA